MPIQKSKDAAVLAPTQDPTTLPDIPTKTEVLVPSAEEQRINQDFIKIPPERVEVIDQDAQAELQEMNAKGVASGVKCGHENKHAHVGVKVTCQLPKGHAGVHRATYKDGDVEKATAWHDEASTATTA